jgi:hypothetical protein
MPDSRPEDVLEALRVLLETRRAEVAQRVEQIRAAADAYAAALDRQLACELAERAGLTGFEPGGVSAAARALLQLVQGLPELASDAETPSRGSAPRSTGSPAEAAEAPTGHANAFVYEASAEARSLLTEVHSLDLEGMPGQLFRAYASELAARARSLQDRGHNAEDIPGRVIRKLTRFAYDRGVLVFGLKRSDKADWDELARKHRAERDRMLAGEPRQLTHRLPLARRDENSSPTASDDESDEAESDDRIDLPHLQQTTRERPLVLVGGISKQEKLERLQSRYGIQAEWVETQRAGTHAIATLEQRVRDGRIAALVVLDGLLGHKHFEPIVDAARRAGTPLAYGNKGGKASIAGALTEIEAQLAPAVGSA